ncbi:MAG: VWA domain-containing protein [Methanobacteriota archaeon]|nr:MAG: VWA domain-containing protein [Euryarchaeota archaeon]
MPLPLRNDTEGVASTVATMFTLLVVLMFLQLTVVAVLPAQEYSAEWATSRAAIDSFERLRLAEQLAVVPGSQFSIPVPLGTDAVSPFSTARQGNLRFDPANTTSIQISFKYVPKLFQATVTHVDQDVVLAIDSSGSMTWNDPSNLRISSAQEYMRNLIPPDRVASIDFDDNAFFTRANIGGPAHFLNYPPNGELMYISPQADLTTIDSAGSTNWGAAIKIANDEFVAHGIPAHAWNLIVLTDGQNTCCPNGSDGDALAIAQSLRAKALGVTIYMIGLGADLNEPLMKTVAANTGGTYYHAVTANDIRWVYYEISRRYLSAFVCGLQSTQEASFGTLQLHLGATRYPAQTMLMEAGAINVQQDKSSTLWRGMPLDYRETGDGLALSATLATLVGQSQTATGTGFETVQGRVIGRDLITQTIQKAPLDQTSTLITSGRQDFEYWATQGAAKVPNAINAVSPYLVKAANYAQWAQNNWTIRNFVNAKFNADKAQGQLSILVGTPGIPGVIDNETTNGDIQGWLAFQTKDNVRVNGCRLGQWLNWYSGVTFRVTSPNAAAWSVWFNETFRAVGAGVTTGVVGGVAVITIRAVDTLVVDCRYIEITFGS